jgi:hypothetical protein
MVEIKLNIDGYEFTVTKKELEEQKEISKKSIRRNMEQIREEMKKETTQLKKMFILPRFFSKHGMVSVSVILEELKVEWGKSKREIGLFQHAELLRENEEELRRIENITLH